MNRITRLVAFREVRETMRKKAFWLSAGGLLLGSTALVVVPEFVGGGNDEVSIAIAGDVPAEVVDEISAVTESLDITTDIQPQPDVAAARELVREGDADYALVGEAWSDDDPDIRFAVLQRTDEVNVVVPVIQDVLRRRATAQIYADASVPERVVDAIAAIEPAHVEVVDTERGGRQAAAFGLTVVMYMLILLLSNVVASSVATAKANRVSEVLLAVAPPRSLLYGKVIGMAALGTATITVGALPIVIRTAIGGSVPDGIGVTLASSGVWFVGGVVIYLLLAAMLGALADRAEEVGGAVAPLTVILILVYLVSLSTLESPVGAVLSVVPFSSPIVMPARIAVGAATTAEVVASLVLLAGGVVLTARLSTLVYTRALVRTGKRLHLLEVLRTPR